MQAHVLLSDYRDGAHRGTLEALLCPDPSTASHGLPLRMLRALQA